MVKIKNNKKVILLIVALLLAFAAVGYYFFVVKDNAGSQVDIESQTTSEVPSAQSDFSQGEEREPGNTLQENEGSAIIEDTNGQDANPNTDSKPVVSDTGQITVYMPTKNSTITSGQVLSGASKLKTVSFRIIDDVSGVIATGQLKVVDGKFSGKMSFTTSAKEGRLDIFSAREDGSEFSNIYIPVRFQ